MPAIIDAIDAANGLDVTIKFDNSGGKNDTGNDVVCTGFTIVSKTKLSSIKFNTPLNLVEFHSMFHQICQTYQIEASDVYVLNKNNNIDVHFLGANPDR